jgi:hypothetical protein
MKKLTCSVFLTLALTAAPSAHAQTTEQSISAYKHRDYPTALAGFKKLADQGNADAQYILGVMYERGKGVLKDPEQAAAWHRKAAEKGISNAQFNLAAMYAEGRGVPKDDQQAMAWYRKAAEQGDAEAQFSLGQMYDSDQGLSKGAREPPAWYRKAVEQGLPLRNSNWARCIHRAGGCPKTTSRQWRGTAKRPGRELPKRS